MILLVLFVILAGMACVMCVSWKLLNALVYLIGASIILAKPPAKLISDVRDIPRRLRWFVLHAGNVICLRRWLIVASVTCVTVVTIIWSLVLRPIYSAACVVKVERDITEIY